MEKLKLYFVEAYDELMHKVTWPTFAELQESSIVVLITALLLSVAVMLVDLGFKTSTIWLYEFLKKLG